MPIPMGFSLWDWLNGRLNNVKLIIRLYQGTIDATTPKTLTDFTEANFAGYGEREFVLSRDPQTFQDLSIGAYSDVVTWTLMNQPVTPQTIGGYYVVARISDVYEVLVAFEQFKEPRVQANIFDSFGVIVALDAGQVVVR